MNIVLPSSFTTGMYFSKLFIQLVKINITLHYHIITLVGSYLLFHYNISIFKSIIVIRLQVNIFAFTAKSWQEYDNSMKVASVKKL